MNKPFVFDLHRDEWRLWSQLGFPRQAWQWGEIVPPSERFGRTLPSHRKQIIVNAEWAERFRVWQVLLDWHSHYFDRVWQEYQATGEETPEPPAAQEQRGWSSVANHQI